MEARAGSVQDALRQLVRQRKPSVGRNAEKGSIGYWEQVLEHGYWEIRLQVLTHAAVLSFATQERMDAAWRAAALEGRGLSEEAWPPRGDGALVLVCVAVEGGARCDGHPGARAEVDAGHLPRAQPPLAPGPIPRSPSDGAQRGAAGAAAGGRRRGLAGH